jgi:Zn-dependent protease
MLDLLFQNPIVFLLWAVSLLVAVTIHEFSHAYIADKLGDPTPRAHGRVSLNPISHLDPIGTFMILVAHIGWGKPVPVDSYNFQNPKRDIMLVSLAGPASNLILASLLAILMKFVPIIAILAVPMIILNVGLAVFNLMPIPPLDGSKILTGLLPGRKAYEWESFTSRYGWYLLLIFIIPFGGRSLASTIISPIINSLLKLFGIY